MRLLLENAALADELVVFLGDAGFAADPAGVLPELGDDEPARAALARHLSVWNALHPEAPARLEPVRPVPPSPR